MNRTHTHAENAREALPSPAARRMPCVPGYLVLKHWQDGGQGSVWLAIAERTKQKVAIKVLHPHHIEHERAKTRFEEAFHALSQLTHPGIVTPLEQGMLDTGELWHATVFVDGWNLDEYVNRLDESTLSHTSRDKSAHFPVRQILKLFIKVCEAVEEAHRKGIIHRDLKPTNIIVDQNGEPHILDFGLAKRVNHTHALTVSEQFIGTPNWASPEQVEGRPGCVDTRSDIYSLGVILFELLTDEFPYDVDKGLARTMEQIRFAEPRRPRTVVSWIDRDLEAIMLKALAKDLSRRYQTVSALREDIGNYLDGRPIHARGDGLVYRTIKLVRRHTLVTATLFALVLASTVYIVQIIRYSARMERYAADATRRFRMARETLEDNIRDTADGLSRIAGAQTLRKQMYDRAYARLSQLIQDEPTDPTMLADYARVHRLLGDVAYQLGQPDQSLDHRNRSLALWRRLAKANPSDVANRHEMSIALILVGDIYHEEGNVPEARPLYEEALTIDEDLAAACPDNISFQDSLCYSYERLGTIDLADGNCDRCRIRFERRQALAQRLFDAYPDDPRCIKNLINAHMCSVAVPRSLDDYADSLDHWRFAEQWSMRLVQADPTNPEYLRLRITALLRLASCEASDEASRDHGEALAHEALDIAYRLDSEEPGHPFYAVFYTDAYGVLGSAAQSRGDYANALLFAQAALEVARDAAAHRPNNWFWQGRVAEILVGLSNRAIAIGHNDVAREYACQVLPILESLTTAASNRPDALMTRIDFLLSAPFEDLRDPFTAVELCKKVISLRKGVRPSDWLLLAEAESASGNPDDASRAAKEGLGRLPKGDSQRRQELEMKLRQIAHRSGRPRRTEAGNSEPAVQSYPDYPQ